MTIVRNEQEPLPRPAQLWASMPSTDGMARFLGRRFTMVCLIAALVPVIVVAIGVGAFSVEIGHAYLAGAEVWGLPVIAIGDAPRGWISIGYDSVGVVAIGLKAVGVIAIGNVAIGVVAIGPVASVGVVSVSVLSVGLRSLGVVSLGWVSNGVFSVGRFALGIIPVGWYACGGHAIGVYAWGVHAAWGFKRAQGIAPLPPPPPPQPLPRGTEKLLFRGGKSGPAT